MDVRFLPVLWRSIRVSSHAWWRAARQLFHESVGAVFALFAVYGALATWRQWKAHPIVWLMIFSVAYTIAMAAFSVVAFRRARRISMTEDGK
jgi:4-hydroxybenzoate polyprenyltransferase